MGITQFAGAGLEPTLGLVHWRRYIEMMVLRFRWIVASITLFLSKGVVAQEKPAALVSPFPVEKVSLQRREWSKYLGISERITDYAGIELVVVPPGEFEMGEQKVVDGLGGADFPTKTTIAEPFYMSTHEVTYGQFAKFVGETDYKTDAENGTLFYIRKEQFGIGGFGWDAANESFDYGRQYNWRNVGFEQSANYPVVNVSWNDAAAFCQWLTAKEKCRYNLPSEAQWEFACRGGTVTSYEHGDQLEGIEKVGNTMDASVRRRYPRMSTAHSGDDGYVHACPVGRFRPNSFGLYDMHGNVAEWCADWYVPRMAPGKVAYGVTHPKTDRVYRGGAWWFPASGCRSGIRFCGQPPERRCFLGFRVVRAAVSPAPTDN